MSKKENFIFNDTLHTNSQYRNDVIIPKLRKVIGEDRNHMSLPKLAAVVVHIRINSTQSKDKSYLQAVERDLALLAGQKCAFTKAKKSVANFKLREGQIVGAKVTLRREKMKSFVTLLRDIVIPGMRDFRGLSKTFDARGGYSMCIFNHDVFPGVNINEVQNIFKVHINFVMKDVKNSKDGFALLDAYEMPFVKNKRGQ